MKIQINEKVEKEAIYLKVIAGVMYWEDASINGIDNEEGNLIPCRDGDSWCPIIEIDTGKIINWEKGKTADIYYKVCDVGEYIITDKDFNIIKSIDGYVPDIMSPKKLRFGDYIIMDVDENGLISKWKPNLKEFINATL